MIRSLLLLILMIGANQSNADVSIKRVNFLDTPDVTTNAAGPLLVQMDGFETLRLLREISTVPVILLTVKGDEEDKIQGLGLGADDYITKPFSPRQLVARAHAVLRRAGIATPPAVSQVADLAHDPSRRELSIGGREAVSLTPLESRLLDYLMLNAGHILTAEAIINHVWGAEGGDRDMLRQLVHRLRLKIAQAGDVGAEESGIVSSVYIETVPSLGYGLIISSSAD